MPESFTMHLRDWLGFYEVMAESSATLTGLMFVAVTIGSRVFTAAALPTLRTLISPTLGYFSTALVLSAAMCVPTQTRTGLGAEMGALSLVGLCRLGALLLSVRALHRRLALERRVLGVAHGTADGQLSRHAHSISGSMALPAVGIECSRRLRPAARRDRYHQCLGGDAPQYDRYCGRRCRIGEG